MRTIEINSFDELKEFLYTNYDNLTDDNFKSLIRATLGAYTFGKPIDVMTAIKWCETFYTRYKDTPIVNRPIFLEGEC
jgi:hypothetical protein